jgi:hypothetical protein
MLKNKYFPKQLIHNLLQGIASHSYKTTQFDNNNLTISDKSCYLIDYFCKVEDSAPF